MSTPVRVSPIDDVSPRAPATGGACSLVDASLRKRITVKGPGAAAFLSSQGVPTPGEILQVARLSGGGFVARTGGGEYFLEDGEAGDVVAKVAAALGAGQDGAYRVLREDASFVLSGAGTIDVLRQTCGVEITDAAPTDRMIFTRVAGVSCAMLALEGATALGAGSAGAKLPGPGRAFQFWVDGTFGEYLFETLSEIAAEPSPAR